MKAETTRENGKIKVRMSRDKYGDELSTTRDGQQWTGQYMTPELARLVIEVLEKYVDDSWDITIKKVVS